MLSVYLDRKKRRRKFLNPTLFRALGFLKEDGSKGTDQEILEMFYTIEELTLRAVGNRENLADLVLVEDAVNEEENVIVARAFEPLSRAVLKQIAAVGVKKIRVVDISVDEGLIIKCMKKDPTHNEEEGLKEIYSRLRPGDPPTVANSRALLKRLFFDPKRYDLGRVGRY